MKRIVATLGLLGVVACLLAACGGGGPSNDDLKGQVVANYAEGIHHLYAKSLESAMELDLAIDQFLQEPTLGRLEVAKRVWLNARDDYGPTEAFRFYDGPIDNPEDGVGNWLASA